MGLLVPFLDDRPEIRDEVRNAAYYKLFNAFYEGGLEVISDADRADAGLPPRNNNGLTAQEAAIIESTRMMASLRNVPPIVVNSRSSSHQPKHPTSEPTHSAAAD